MTEREFKGRLLPQKKAAFVYIGTLKNLKVNSKQKAPLRGFWKIQYWDSSKAVTYAKRLWANLK